MTSEWLSVSPAQCLEIAVRIGERVSRDLRSRYLARGEIAKVSSKLFYNGLPGQLLYLLILNVVVSDMPPIVLGVGEVLDLAQQYSIRDNDTFPACFVGGYGWALSLAYMSALTGSFASWPALVALLDAMDAGVVANQKCDVMSGLAGCLLTLRVVDAVRPCGDTATKINAYLAILSKRAVREKQSCWWPSDIDSTRPLLGFAHGAAGIAAALSLTTESSHKGEVSGLAHALSGALAYERSCFDAQNFVWPDYRAGHVTAPMAASWCAGAVGIGFSRLLCLRNDDSRLALEDITRALRIALQSRPRENFCLCHGRAGTVDFVAALGTAGLLAPSQRVDVGIFLRTFIDDASHLINTWLSDVRTPLGLMTGLAGIGYAMLRITHSEEVPSILGFALPTRMPQPPHSYH